MMCADWKYDENKKGKLSNKSKTRYSYRNQCAIWAIQTYIKNSLRKNKTIYLNNLINSEDEIALTDILEDKKQQQAEDIYIHQEEEESNTKLVQNILSSSLLTAMQKEKMRMHYIEGQSLAEIGRRYGVTREAIRQTIQGCIKKLQGEFA
jgi:RNA polymerase sigma factor (sigma-70 family)